MYDDHRNGYQDKIDSSRKSARDKYNDLDEMDDYLM